MSLIEVEHPPSAMASNAGSSRREFKSRTKNTPFA
jgi:hypothetical protein